MNKKENKMTRKPEMGLIGPDWCHHHCRKMELTAIGICKDYLILQGSAAELVISRKGGNWLVSWKVIQSLDAQTIGQTIFTSEDLSRAFDLTNDMGKHGEWLIDRYGGTTASQGKFIRYKNWLNIPCPGTAHDGDPNISIDIDEGIKKAVMDLVYHCR